METAYRIPSTPAYRIYSTQTNSMHVRWGLPRALVFASLRVEFKCPGITRRAHLYLPLRRGVSRVSRPMIATVDKNCLFDLSEFLHHLKTHCKFP